MESNFSAAINNYTTNSTTANGAISLVNPDTTMKATGRISLLYKTVRGLSEEKLKEFLIKSCNESLVDTILLAFYIRDCRNGKGERKLGRLAFQFLLSYYPDQFIKCKELISEYGRWDDVIQLWPIVFISGRLEYQNLYIKLMADQLVQDLDDMLSGKPISLCAKWAPTQGCSADRKYDVVARLIKELGVSYENYRKVYLSPLRAYLKIVERYMCSGRWDEIDFNKVPSCAMNRLKKAFEKHSPENFKLWKSKLSSGETKVNAAQLYPHEICSQLRGKNNSDELLEAQWKIIQDKVSNLGNFQNILVVVDTSGSMNNWSCPNPPVSFIPLDVSCALGLIISNAVKGKFHNHIITFHQNPQFAVIPDGTIFSKWNVIKKIPWGGSTNIQGVFNLILNAGKTNNLKQEDMPAIILIISDMQFNKATSQNHLTNFEAIEEQYKKSNYIRPNIVFWNVNGYDDFPVSVQDNGTALVSGFSPSLMKGFLNNGKFDPYEILRTLLDDPRYDAVRNVLSE